VRKNIAPYDAEKPASTGRPWLALRVALLTLAVGPFVYEGTLGLYARWARILGKPTAIRTPVLDTVQQILRLGRLALAGQFHRVPWKPGIVLFFGVASCAVCMYLLRGRGSHVE
jgi:hypothetical protein